MTEARRSHIRTEHRRCPQCGKFWTGSILAKCCPECRPAYYRARRAMYRKREIRQRDLEARPPDYKHPMIAAREQIERAIRRLPQAEWPQAIQRACLVLARSESPGFVDQIDFSLRCRLGLYRPHDDRDGVRATIPRRWPRAA